MDGDAICPVLEGQEGGHHSHHSSRVSLLGSMLCVTTCV